MHGSRDYLPRVVDAELDDILPSLPAVSIEGAKGVGKTATALRRALTAFRLDDPRELEIISADPDRLTSGAPPVLIDEWQRYPAAFDLVRRAVDDGVGAGTFLLTGSPPAPGVTVHSGAGRIVVVRMRPLSLAERGIPSSVSLRNLMSGRRPAISGWTAVTVSDYADEIVRSGFPGLRDTSDRVRRLRLDGYLDSIVQREFPEMGHIVRNPASLRRWLVAYAAATSSSASLETIRDAATGDRGEKPSRDATGPYREILERLHIVEPLPAWLPTNRLARAAAAPKHHLVDPGLAARLLGADRTALLSGGDIRPVIPRDGTLLGALFESLVTLDLRVYAQAAEARVGHLRTHRGEREVDLIIERGDGRVVAVEVKLSATIDDADVRHLKWLAERVGDDLLDSLVVTTGREAYRRPTGSPWFRPPSSDRKFAVHPKPTRGLEPRTPSLRVMCSTS